MIQAAFLSLMVAVFVGIAQPMPVAASSAETFARLRPCPTRGVADFLGFKAWDNCLEHAPNGGAPRITGINDVWVIIFTLMEDFMKAAAYVAVGFIIWGGVKYTKSQGAPGETEQARTIIHNALFGLVLTMLSIGIVNVVANAF